MSGRVHFSSGDDRLDVESGGTLTVKSGGALRVEQGVLVEVPHQLVSFAGTALTLAPDHAGKYITTTNGSAISITVPAGIDVPIGIAITVEQGGTGQVTFVAAGGVTIQSPETLKTAKQYAVAMLVKKAADVWTLVGYLEAA